MSIIIYILISVFIVSLLSFVGVVTLPLPLGKLKKITMSMVSFSAGALLGDAFIHLMPEAAKNNDSLTVWFSLLGGLLIFFILEKVVCWRHCHIPTSSHHPHPVGVMNLVGDVLHNFLDGVVIAASFLVSVPLGITTTLAVFAHEVPQEIGNFGVLIHAGYSRSKALWLNFLVTLTAILGAIITIFVGQRILIFSELAIPFTAGGFIYIATADLIPELKKEVEPVQSIIQLVFILFGMAIMLVLKVWLG